MTWTWQCCVAADHACRQTLQSRSVARRGSFAGLAVAGPLVAQFSAHHFARRRLIEEACHLENKSAPWCSIRLISIA